MEKHDAGVRVQVQSMKGRAPGGTNVEASGVAVPRRPLRVVIGNLGLGGAEGHLLQVLPALCQRGWSPRVVTVLEPGPLAEAMRRSGVPVAPLPSALALRGWPRWLRRSLGVPVLVRDLIAELRARPQDITWMMLPEAYLLTMAAVTLGRHTGRLVMSRRSLNRYQRRLAGTRTLERAFHRRVDAVLANSAAVREELRQLEGVAPERLALIYNGIDCQRFANAAPRAVTRHALGLPQDARVLITVANLIHYKGHGDLLHALGAVRERLPQPWRLLCVGAGDQAALRLLAGKLGLSGQVLWLGSRADVPDLLAASDVGVLASHEEGFSNAVLECMAAGLPMVVTAVGGNAEAVLDGRTGLVVPARAPGDLGEAIARLAGDAGLSRRLGAEGRKRVNVHFSLARCVDDYDRVLTALVQGQSVARAMARVHDIGH